MNNFERKFYDRVELVQNSLIIILGTMFIIAFLVQYLVEVNKIILELFN